MADELYTWLETKEKRRELTPEEEKRAEILAETLKKLQKKWNWSYRKARLLAMTGFTARWPGNVEPLKPEETDLILRLTWGSWDWLVHSLATGTAEELRQYFPRSFAASYVEERAKPAAEKEKKFTLDVEARDAVPVYLDCSTGKILVSFSSLDLSLIHI